jgi:DNA-binding XRE family transcriptional regulator
MQREARRFTRRHLTPGELSPLECSAKGVRALESMSTHTLNKVCVDIFYAAGYAKPMKNLHEIVGRHHVDSPSLIDFPLAVGERLRRQRVAFHWRQVDLAQQAGVSVQTVKAMEKGKSISYENLIRMLLAFGHGIDFLRMLETPHFPNLRAQERYVELDKPDALHKKRIR